MPYLILRESYVTDSCVLDGLPVNEIRKEHCRVLFCFVVCCIVINPERFKVPYSMKSLKEFNIERQVSTVDT